MSNAYGGSSISLNYRGNRAVQPPNMTFAKVNPTESSKNASLGDFWLNTETKELFVLMSLEGTTTSHGQVATWVLLASGIAGNIDQITTDSGVALPVSGNINLFSTTGRNNGTVTFDATGETIRIIFDDSAANLGIGSTSLGRVLTSGQFNVCVGQLSGFAMTSGSSNTGMGYEALEDVTTGSNNTCIGTGSIGSATTPSHNTCLGTLTGSAYRTSESSNILIGHNVSGTLGESHTLRIGVASGTGAGELNRAFVQGIAGVSVSNKNVVTIDTVTGQLGSEASAVSATYFSAYQSSTVNNVTGDGTDYTIIFDTEIADVGAGYDNTTGVFTAPATGFYSFNANAFAQGIGAGHTQIGMSIVTSSATFIGPLYNPVPIDVGGVIIATVQATCLMTAGDTAQAVIAVNNDTKTVGVAGQALGSGAITFFQGYRVA